MRRFLAPIALVAILSLAGCSTGPSREDVAERFTIELAAAIGSGDQFDWSEVGSSMADNALDGNCSSEAFRSALEDSSARRAWDIGCLMYFEDEMSPAQVERAKLAVLG